MSLPRAAGLVIAALVSATAVSADVKGVANPPSFTPEELDLIGRDDRLIDATRSCPWRLRHALDVWEDLRHAAPPPTSPAEPVRCTQPGEDEGRASAEGPFDLLQILKEAAGQGSKR